MVIIEQVQVTKLYSTIRRFAIFACLKWTIDYLIYSNFTIEVLNCKSFILRKASILQKNSSGCKLLRPSRDRTPEPAPHRKPHIHPRLRKRLILTPEKNQSQQLGHFIAKKLKSLQNLEKAVTVS